MNSQTQLPKQFCPINKPPNPTLYLSIHPLIYGSTVIHLSSGDTFVVEDLKHLTEVLEREKITEIKIQIEK
jgi:hypothetical protein